MQFVNFFSSAFIKSSKDKPIIYIFINRVLKDSCSNKAAKQERMIKRH